MFGLSLFSTALPALLISMIAFAIGLYTVYKLFGYKTGMIFGIICTANPWHFTQSRWFMDANFFPHFFIIATCLLYFAIIQNDNANKRRFCFIVSIIMYALSHYCYGVSVYIVPIFLVLIYIWAKFKNLISTKEFFFSVLIYIFVSAPFYLMLVINTFKLDTIYLPFMTIPYFSESKRANDILFFSSHPLSQLIENVRYFFSVILSQQTETIWTIVPKFGSLMLFTIPFIVLGILVLGNNLKNKKEIMNTDSGLAEVLLFFWLFVSFLDGIITRDVNSNRLNVIFYCLMIFMAIGIRTIAECSKKLFIISMSLLLFMSSLFLFDYFTVYASRFYNPNYSFSGNFDLALYKAKEYNADYYVITPDTQYEGAVDVTEVDTLFIFDIDAKYYLGIKDGENEEKVIPYSEKYQYRKVTVDDSLNYDSSIVYIVNSGEESIFDEEYYEIIEYSQFVVVIPKWMLNK